MNKYFDPKISYGTILTIVTMVIGGFWTLSAISQKFAVQTALIEQRLDAQEKKPSPDPATAFRLQALEGAARDLAVEMRSLRADVSKLAR